MHSEYVCAKTSIDVYRSNNRVDNFDASRTTGSRTRKISYGRVTIFGLAEKEAFPGNIILISFQVHPPIRLRVTPEH